MVWKPSSIFSDLTVRVACPSLFKEKGGLSSYQQIRSGVECKQPSHLGHDLGCPIQQGFPRGVYGLLAGKILQPTKGWMSCTYRLKSSGKDPKERPQ